MNLERLPGPLGKSCTLSIRCATFASQVVLAVKNLPANAGDIRDMGLMPGKIHLHHLEFPRVTIVPPP